MGYASEKADWATTETVRTNDEIKEEQIEVNISKQNSGWTRKKKRNDSMAFPQMQGFILEVVNVEPKIQLLL